MTLAPPADAIQPTPAASSNSRPSISLDNALYAELKARVRDAGLLRSSPGLMLFNVAWLALAVGASVYLLSLMDNTWLLLAGAVVTAVLMTHVAYIGHDSGHRQVFATPRFNDYVSLGLMPFVGFSGAWWRAAHNAHHANPNHEALDPNVRVPILAFSPEQWLAKTPKLKAVTRYQVLYYVPMIALEILGMHLTSLYFLATTRVRYRWAELAAMVAFFVLLGFALLSLMSPWQALAFFLVHELTKGLYLGAVFAPNHKGMELVDDVTNGGFLWRQITTTRNVRPSYFVDWLMGGLNYQVEHHLFPTIPRLRLRQTRLIVRAFCIEKGLPYYETSLWASYVEVFKTLRLQQSIVLRMPAVESRKVLAGAVD